jgi:hypothetical protein
MKPLTQLGCALVIALTSGGGGYWIGKSRSPAASDPAAAVAASDARSRRSAAVPQDLPDLRRRLDAEKNSLVRFQLALPHLESWVAKDPAGALDWLAGQTASRRRDELVRLALKQYSETDAKGAAEWALRNLSGGNLNNSLIAIANEWADQNGREAAAWFLKLPVTRERNAAVENMFFIWGSNEPASALEFLRLDSSVGSLSPTLQRAALAGWAKSDPEAAVTASLESSRTRNDPGQFANTLANWATLDLDASSQWLLAKVPASEQRTSATRELAAIFAQQDPAAGTVWLDKLTAGQERDYAAGTLVAEWSRDAPAEAAKWAAGQTSSSLAPEAVGEVCRNFLRKDSAAFQAWRDALPPGAIKDQARQVGANPDEE